MHLKVDDALHRIKGYWVEAKGTPMGGFRYTAWGIAIVTAPIFYLMLLPIFDVFVSIAFGIGIAAGVAKFGSDQIGGEYTLWSWITLFGSEAKTLWRHRHDYLPTYVPRLRQRTQTPVRYRG